MKTEDIIIDERIKHILSFGGWNKSSPEEMRLILAELLLKAGAGYYNSHTEEAFMNGFNMLKKDRTPNKEGRRFLCSMFYHHSNRRPEAYSLMNKYRDKK